MRQRKVFPVIINLAVFISLEIASLVMLSRNADLQRRWIARGAHRFMGAVWGTTQGVARYFTLGKANKDLALENFRLQEELSRAQNLLHQASIDTMTSVYAGRPGFTFISAEVV